MNIEIPESAAHKACAVMQVWHDNPSDDRYYHEAMRAALQAALAEMLEPVGWQGEDTGTGYLRTYESEKDFAHLTQHDWFKAHRTYRIRGQ